MTPLQRLARLSSVSTLILSSLFASAQTPAPRIRGPIEAAPSVRLEGSLNPHLRTADDLGPLAPDTPIPGITLVFKRSDAQEADLQQLLTQQVEPTSPLFHHWLTPEDFAARFGVAGSDIAATEAWLQSHGFTIDSVSRGRDRLTFSGTAAQVQQAFGAELHRLRWQNELHFAPSSELSLPPTLAPLTAAVLHLSDFRPIPTVRAIHPDYTTASNQSHFLAPSDVATMYDLVPLYNRQLNGTGQQLAIVGQSYVNTFNGSVNTFQLHLGGNSNSVTNVIVPNTGVEAIFPGDVGESEIDLEYSSAMAPAANVFFVYTGSNRNYDVIDALTFAIEQDVAPVLSISYSVCEPLVSTSDLQANNATFEQAAAQGQTIIAASGDNGSEACAPFTSVSGFTTAQQQQLAVSFPASSPFVTAVGGTQMAPGTFAAGTSNYWASAGTTDNTASLQSYVPEVVWNEDSSSLGLLASGGGASITFARPAWQSSIPGIPSGSFRLVPDIALQASIASPGYIICTDDPDIIGSGGSSCSNGLKNSSGTYTVSGGTSFAAPIFAGFIALLNQSEHAFGSGQGNANPVLYGLAAQPSVYSTVFHDITTGTTACVSGDGNCGTPGESAYAATPGYDQATGLGSLDFNQLALAWRAAPPSTLTPTDIVFNGTPTNATPSSTTTLDIIVGNINANSAPAPTGSVAIALDGAIVNPSLAFTTIYATDSTTTYSLATPSTVGSHIISVFYPGDSTHAASIANFSILVGSVVASGNITLSANNLSIENDSSGSTQVTITPSGGYNGNLTWSSSYTGGTAAATLCYVVQSPAVSGPTTATVYMGVGTACESSSALRVPSRGPRASAHPPAHPSSRQIPGAAALALLLCIIPARRRRRTLPALLSIASLAFITFSLTGCGGGSGGGGGGGGGGGPQPEVYTISLTAQDSVNSAITASTTFTLTVN